MEMDHGRDESWHKVVSAFNTSSFRLGEGKNGETVLTLVVGESGVISFILPGYPGYMEDQLFDALSRCGSITSRSFRVFRANMPFRDRQCLVPRWMGHFPVSRSFASITGSGSCPFNISVIRQS